AIAAANRSHMPYSKSPSGVALECKDGRIFSGSYAENAAFNPTLPPLQGALILLNLKGYDYPDIQRAVLAEKADALKPGAGCGVNALSGLPALSWCRNSRQTVCRFLRKTSG
ncbi:hypothetical protein ACUWFG_20225, partial [Escherichia coli]